MVLIFVFAFFAAIAVPYSSPANLSAIAYVSLLAPLVAARQQDDESGAAPNEINAIARSVTDPHLRHAVANRSYVAGIPDLQTIDARLDASLSPGIAQAREPTRKDLGLTNFGHGLV
jgi:hypothetical protein